MEHPHDRPDRPVGFGIELAGRQALLHDAPEVCEDHEGTERKARRSSGQQLVPAPLRVVQPPDVAPHGGAGFVPVPLLTGRGKHRRSSHRRKAIRKDAVRRHGGDALAIQRKIVAAVPGAAVLEQEVKPLPRNFEILRMPLAAAPAIELREHIDDPPLHPHVLGRIVDRTVAVQHREVAAVFAVHAVLHPERNHIPRQLILVSFDHRLPVHFDLHFSCDCFLLNHFSYQIKKDAPLFGCREIQFQLLSRELPEIRMPEVSTSPRNFRDEPPDRSPSSLSVTSSFSFDAPETSISAFST